MDDNATSVLAGHTKKYNIPLSHFEYKYIENCTDGKELERIYKELISGELGSFPDLERVTFNRIKDIKPNSQILRKDKDPLDKSSLPDDERQKLDDFLNRMRQKTQTTSINSKDQVNNDINSIPIRSKTTISKSTSSSSVIKSNGKPKRIVPRSYDEWGKLSKQLSKELNSDNEDNRTQDKENNHTNQDGQRQTNESHSSNKIDEISQRLRMAEQHRLNGNAAFKSNNFQQAIDLYTESIRLDSTNSTSYMNRAIANHKLNNYDASITDCCHILSKDPYHIKALFRRASCHLAKQQYHEAKRDLNALLTIDPDSIEAQNLLKTIPNVQKPKGIRIPITEDDGDNEDVNNQPSMPKPVKIPIAEVEEEGEEEEEEEKSEQHEVTNEMPQSMNVDIPQNEIIHSRPCIDSKDASPAMFDNHFDQYNEFQNNVHAQFISHGVRVTNNVDDDDDEGDNDNDDDIALGAEASAGFLENMSDDNDDRHNSHSLNVSPTMNDDDVPELIGQKSLQTPPLTPPTQQTANRFSTAFRRQQNDDYDDLYDDNRTIPTISNNYSFHKQNSLSSNSFETNNDIYNLNCQQQLSTINFYNEQISKLNFSSIIQNWLRDLVQLESSRRLLSMNEKLWSKSYRPWSLDKLQRDIERYHRLNEFKCATETSKKMLKNGVLDYHHHADHIVSTLVICAQCYAKTNNYVHAIQYTSEALQYNKIDTSALICRAKAFENENMLLFSYADYARISPQDYTYSFAQDECKRLTVELNRIEGETWQDKLPQDHNDDRRYFTFIRNKDESSHDDQYDWYRKRGNQLYLDACFVLAIQCYTYCIELKPDIPLLYSNRAACYLKLFEAQKALDDCDKALKMDPENERALYRKACAYKMSDNKRLYELTLKNFIQLKPNNQTILAEYYSIRHEQIPRRLRRLRMNPINEDSSMSNQTSTNINEQNHLSYEELEQMRQQIKFPFSKNMPHQFIQQLDILKSNDTKNQCSLILRLPTKGLYEIVRSATPKLVETIVDACQIMVNAEKCYQQKHKSSILSFSYITFCFKILIELTTIPRLDSALSMINPNSRYSLDSLLSYYSSIPSVFNDVKKLERLRK